MKVVHLLKTGEYSGAENVVITIIEQMKIEYGVDSVYISPSGSIDKILNEKEIEHYVIHKPTVREFRTAINNLNPDIIHAHDFSNSLVAACLNTNAAIISHLHNNPPWLKTPNVKSIALYFALRKFRYVLGVSQSVLDEYCYKRSMQEKYRVVGNPIFVDEIVRRATICRKELESDVVFIGRMTLQKNPLFFIEVINKYAMEKGPIKALMIGKGELLDDCMEKIKQYSLEKSIMMLGFQENPYNYLKNTKILCIPSLWEGFGLVVIEAFSFGIPVVATPVGGMKELVTDSSGRLCETEDEFCDEIYRLLSNKEYYMKKSVGARERAIELENGKQYIETLYGYYQK